jgi:dTDP-4-dehydrorhamnose 3,5-epimerase
VEITRCPIPGVILITPTVHGDARGFFFESYNARDLERIGIDAHFVQDNHSRSAKGVLRGLHYQLEHPQGKLVRVAAGAIFDVAADIRVGSPTFGQWFGAILDDVKKQSLWIPPGFAHGFCVLSDSADVLYKATEFYAQPDERGIIWNDPLLAIAWPTSTPILSAKDQAYEPLKNVASELPRYS